MSCVPSIDPRAVIPILVAVFSSCPSMVCSSLAPRSLPPLLLPTELSLSRGLKSAGSRVAIALKISGP